jgi:hypothetical protein
LETSKLLELIKNPRAIIFACVGIFALTLFVITAGKGALSLLAIGFTWYGLFQYTKWSAAKAVNSSLNKSKSDETIRR